MPSKKSRSRRSRRTYRRRHGGAAALSGSPLNASLADGWSSRMSAGQGADYLAIHKGQHGGMAPVQSIGAETLSGPMRTAAMLSGLDRAMADIRGLRDQAGGRHRKSHRRRHHGKSHRSRRHGKSHRRHSKSHRRHLSRRRRGGALGFAPVGMAGMLSVDHSAAGLNPEWNNSVEQRAAAARDAL